MSEPLHSKIKQEVVTSEHLVWMTKVLYTHITVLGCGAFRLHCGEGETEAQAKHTGAGLPGPVPGTSTSDRHR